MPYTLPARVKYKLAKERTVQLHRFPAARPSRQALHMLRRLARQWQGKSVGLYGGSFNPAHAGHLHVAEAALRHCKLDAVWMLLSPGNPLKDGRAQTAFKTRFQHLEQLTEPFAHIYASDIEAQLGTRKSVDTVAALTKAMPNTDFVWLMGADNLANFHLWHAYDAVARLLPIAVFDRPGYSMAGCNSKFSKRYAKYRVPAERLTKHPCPAWAFVRIVRHRASATQIRSDVQGPWIG